MVQHHEQCEIATQTIDRGKPHRWRSFVFKYKRDFDRQECQERQSYSEDRIRNVHMIGKVGYFAIIYGRVMQSPASINTPSCADLQPVLTFSWPLFAGRLPSRRVLARRYAGKRVMATTIQFWFTVRLSTENDAVMSDN